MLSHAVSAAPPHSQRYILLVSARKKHAAGSPTTKIQLERHTTVPSQSVEILGMVFQSDRANTILINKLKNTTALVVHLIRRIATKTRGMCEADALQLFQAFVLS
ncbi:hypothetical protein HPB49_023970 [Dermacentor silvarum]|uniref:Uncharacterized protein n=1 Tax=Dermacentor silvarum TaxID=543639 RepID=A0ACB8D8Q9_DERSI|nr:hypothetical protein HPB49_023970 [Dermacentor silvarum]